jgi:sulfate permease, SulP family
MILTKLFPFLAWFRSYNKSDFKFDIVSGLTVALVIIPQSMAYAQLAGLPVHYGLYASLLPPIIAALFGSSRQLATGPVAIVSLMTAASLEPLATAGSTEYVMFAIILAFTVGMFQLLLGVIRLGLIINLLSHPVVNGFSNAAAIIIASSQLSKLFGVYVDNAPHHYETIYHVVEAAIDYTHVPTLLIGLLSIAIMFFMKRYLPKLPNVLVAVVVTTVLAYLIGFENNQRTDRSKISSREAISVLEQFNSSVNRLKEYGEKITKVNKIIEELEATQPESEELLKQVNLMSENNFHKKKIKHQIVRLRAEIRNLKFNQGTDSQGNTKFFVAGSVPVGFTSDDNIWRIKIGYNAIDMSSMLMIGGGAVVGQIPVGLPSIAAPQLNLSIFLQMLPFAIIISLLGFMEAIAIAKAMASKTGQKIDPNQELIGQGLGNILGSFAGSYPVSGSFSRSAVNLQTGAVTGLSSAITSVVVAVTLLFFTPLLYFLPQSVLASIIMMAVIGLVNVKGFIHAWRAKWYDGVISVIAFIATLLAAPHLEEGIYLGVALSLGVYLYQSMRPKITTLSRHYDLSLRDSEFHQLDECQYTTLIRFGGPLIFANASYLEEEINKRMRQKKELKHIIIVCNSINDMDASGEEALALLIERVRSAGVNITFSGMNETIVALLKRTHLYEKIGDKCIFPTMEKAISAIIYTDHGEHMDEECPLLAMHHLMYVNMNRRGQ